MFILTIVLAALLAAAFLSAGVGKLAGLGPLPAAQRHLGFTPGVWKLIGALEIMGAAGLIVGLFDRYVPVGVLAGAGLVAMTIGAGYFHQMAGDGPKEWMPAVVVGSFAIFFVILRIATS